MRMQRTRGLFIGHEVLHLASDEDWRRLVGVWSTNEVDIPGTGRFSLGWAHILFSETKSTQLGVSKRDLSIHCEFQANWDF